MFEPRVHMYAVPFDGRPGDALEQAETTLQTLGFDVRRGSESELRAARTARPGARREGLDGVAALRFRASPGRIQVTAKLVDVEAVKAFVYLFPPVLIASLLVLGSLLDPSFSILNALWIVPWLAVAPRLCRALDADAAAAVNRLLIAVARSKGGRPVAQ